jgi:hypothetical protein
MTAVKKKKSLILPNVYIAAGFGPMKVLIVIDSYVVAFVFLELAGQYSKVSKTNSGGTNLL